jgi:hypothetical protein
MLNNPIQSNIMLAPEYDQPTASDEELIPKIHKKRGRKPKGGKIISNIAVGEPIAIAQPNIIVHLKCWESELIQNNFLSTNTYDPTVQTVETFQFGHDLPYQVIDELKNTVNEEPLENNTFPYLNARGINTLLAPLPQPNTLLAQQHNSLLTHINLPENESLNHIYKKIKELTVKLHMNNFSDKKAACFWCTYDFDNPPIYIPKFELNNTYHCYGCFCSPECATAYLFKEAIDTSTRFERYHLLNHIYCKIYDYNKNVKPAPDPFHTLNKYYGNLSIQEYRRLLKNERLLLIVDKPLSRTLPELHEDVTEFVINANFIPSASKFKLKRKNKQSKSDIISENFNMK